MVDFEALKKRLTIEQAVAILGLSMKQSGNQLRGACPACNSDDPRTLVVTPSKGVFYCFSANKGGDLLALAAHVRDESIRLAAEFLAGTVKVTATVPATVPDTPPPAKVPFGFDRAKYQAGLDRAHELLKDIPQDFITRADIGVSNKGALKGIVIPTYDKDTHEFICYVKVEGIQLPKATVTPLKKVS